MENAAEPGSRVGEVLAGKYHLERLLGSGGMGAVYEALHAFTQRRVAVKLMHPTIARSRVAAERFLREARAPGSIGHTGIVEVLDGGHAEDGTLYLVMEVLQGETLAAALRKKRLRLQEIAAIVLELLDILDSAHEAGFVHRDIKPENVFLEESGEDGQLQVKLLDFGVAGVIDGAERSSDPKLTRAGAVLGTPLYMSPEQALGRAVDARADLWSVGALLYQAIAGAPPYSGDSFHALVVSISTQEHVPIGMLRPDLPPRLHAVIERALRKDPDKRWPSARDMASALAAAIEGRATAHDQGTLVHSAPPEEPSLPVRAVAVAEGPSALRIMLIGMAAVTALGALAYLVTLGPWSSQDGAARARAPIEAETALIPEPPSPKPLASPALAEEAPAAPAQEPAPAAPAAASAPAAQGLSAETLGAILSAAQPSLQRCYEQAMVAALTEGEEPLPALAFEASFGVVPDGQPERVRLEPMKGKAPAELQACLQGALERLRFPAAQGPSEARFPIVFQSAVVGP